jgi:hypothetical protein
MAGEGGNVEVASPNRSEAEQFYWQATCTAAQARGLSESEARTFADDALERKRQFIARERSEAVDLG